MYGMKPGTRFMLVMMADPYPVPPGTVGIIEGRDALGDYLVSWSNGSSLKLIPEADTGEVISSEESPATHPIAFPSHRPG